jgi:prepilin-type N-terminal cleavage/methylation domain-containing protein
VSDRRGLTLLEVLVALVILSLVVVGCLQLFSGSLGSATAARTWSQAVVYAEDAMEAAKLGPTGPRPTAVEALPGGFRRRVTVRPWGAGVVRVTVTVAFPDGGQFDLDRLERLPTTRSQPRMQPQ